MSGKPKLSIVILSYNTKGLLRDCLKSLEKVEDEVSFEVIVPDSGSVDSSVEMVRKEFPQAKLVEIGKNLGFAAGNNKARKYCKGKYILFLNSDTVVHKNVLRETIRYMDKNHEVGALSCKLTLLSGEFDKDTRRSFVTPWIGFTHLFLRIDRLFPKSKLFAKYWYGWISSDTMHEVDVIEGAYFLTRKKLLDELDWFSEEYFLDGENIDLCWRIKEESFKIMYYPKVEILHVKGASKGKIGVSTRRRVPLRQRLKFRMSGVNSMEIFYRKRLWNKYPLVLNILVLIGIKFMKAIRFVRTVVLG